MSKTERRKENLEFLFKRYLKTKSFDYYEQDTATKFIKPLLKILGWDIYDISQVREEVQIRVGDKNSPRADCVLYHDGKPYIVLEIKGLGFGNLPRTSGDEIVKSLIENARTLNAKYAVLTRYVETVIFDPTNSKELVCFGKPEEYVSNFESIWRYLSFPKCEL